MNKLRTGAVILAIVAFVVIGFCDLYFKRWDTSIISFLLAGVNGLVFFGH